MEETTVRSQEEGEAGKASKCWAQFCIEAQGVQPLFVSEMDEGLREMPVVPAFSVSLPLL